MVSAGCIRAGVLLQAETYFPESYTVKGVIVLLQANISLAKRFIYYCCRNFSSRFLKQGRHSRPNDKAGMILAGAISL